eukprot:CAMPEP_0203780722 /NCGR_PEP_ID=MMETSP0099_2-20121227/9666_1 /ASSEMBLY_ACC=CAM_ASM_000209 /TAXON_ID=96639 /ORGANISM=" , Strain NY0313808BC1" /LENGTH=57 /DNA_ID=CAMNT_0050681285 /DNA_START=62 /DNA_END=235 /DNA_ORIENTATION=+
MTFTWGLNTNASRSFGSARKTLRSGTSSSTTAGGASSGGELGQETRLRVHDCAISFK